MGTKSMLIALSLVFVSIFLLAVIHTYTGFAVAGSFSNPYNITTENATINEPGYYVVNLTMNQLIINKTATVNFEQHRLLGYIQFNATSDVNNLSIMYLYGDQQVNISANDINFTVTRIYYPIPFDEQIVSALHITSLSQDAFAQINITVPKGFTNLKLLIHSKDGWQYNEYTIINDTFVINTLRNTSDIIIVGDTIYWPQLYHDPMHTDHTPERGPVKHIYPKYIVGSYNPSYSISYCSDNIITLVKGKLLVIFWVPVYEGWDRDTRIIEASSGRELCSLPVGYMNPQYYHGLVYTWNGEYGYTYFSYSYFDSCNQDYNKEKTIEAYDSPYITIDQGVMYLGTLPYKLDFLVYDLKTPAPTKLYSAIYDSYVSPPTVYNGVVYIHVIPTSQANATAYALNATNGVQLWNLSYHTLDPNNIYRYTNILAYNGAVYFGVSNNNIYAVNTTTFKIMWKFPTKANPYGITMYNGKIIFSTGENITYALNATTGKQIWNLTLPLSGFGSMATSGNGMLYIDSGKDTYGINATTGKLVWDYKYSERKVSPLIVYNNTVYIASPAGLMALTEDNEPPSIKPIYPLNETMYHRLHNVTVSVTDNYKVAKVIANIDGINYTLHNLNGDKYYIPHIFPNGTHVIIIYASDPFNQTTTMYLTFNLNDTYPPTVSLVNPKALQFFEPVNYIEFNITDDSNVSTAYFYYNNTKYTLYHIPHTSFWVNYSLSFDPKNYPFVRDYNVTLFTNDTVSNNETLFFDFQSYINSWPMTYYTYSNTGYTHSKSALQPMLLWKYKCNPKQFAVINNELFVTTSSNLIKLNAFNGSLVWSKYIADGLESPIVATLHRVYVLEDGSDLIYEYDHSGNLVKRYVYTGGSSIYYPPGVIYNNYVIFDSSKVNLLLGSAFTLFSARYDLVYNDKFIFWYFPYNSIYALPIDISSSDNYQSHAIWTHKIYHVTHTTGYKGSIYVGTSDDYLYALNATNGTEVWHFTAKGPIYSPIVTGHNMIFFGTDDNVTYALNATTGKQIWNFTTNGTVHYTLILAKDILYVGSNSGYIYALNYSNGHEIWRYKLGGAVTYLASANNMLYAGSKDGYLYAFATPPTKIIVTLDKLPYTKMFVNSAVPSFDSGPMYLLGIKLINMSNNMLLKNWPVQAYISNGNIFVYSINAKQKLGLNVSAGEFYSVILIPNYGHEANYNLTVISPGALPIRISFNGVNSLPSPMPNTYESYYKMIIGDYGEEYNLISDGLTNLYHAYSNVIQTFNDKHVYIYNVTVEGGVIHISDNKLYCTDSEDHVPILIFNVSNPDNYTVTVTSNGLDSFVGENDKSFKEFDSNSSMFYLGVVPIPIGDDYHITFSTNISSVTIYGCDTLDISKYVYLPHTLSDLFNNLSDQMTQFFKLYSYVVFQLMKTMQ